MPKTTTKLFRARVTKCSITNVDLNETQWNCDRLPSRMTAVYKTEAGLLRRNVPRLGRFKVAILREAFRPSSGIGETLIIWNGKTVLRTEEEK